MQVMIAHYTFLSIQQKTLSLQFLYEIFFVKGNIGAIKKKKEKKHLTVNEEFLL
jgi:hypothetical protein